MIYQNYVSYYTLPGFPGDPHNNDRHASIYRSSVNTVADSIPGVGQTKIGLYDHTRLLLAAPTAANVVADGNYVGVVARTHTARSNYSNRTAIGSVGSAGSNNIIPAGEHVRFQTNGTVYVYVEKAINPNLPVFMRVGNAVGALQGIGFFTDTAAGADTVLLPNARWYGTDAATYIASKDAGYTAAFARQNIGMTLGFSWAPVQFRFGAAEVA